MSDGASFAWFPPDDARESTNVGRFLTRHGIDDLASLRARSIAEPEWFWPAVVDFLGLEFATPWTSVVDASNGIEWATWFNGATCNVASWLVDRWAAETPDKIAITWEGEDGATRSWTYAELRREVDSCATQLSLEGIGRGDAVGIFLPMLPETVAALLAVMKLGAVFLPLFSGYGADAVAARLADAKAKALVFADGTYRRGKQLDMLSVGTKAIEQCPTVTTTVIVPRLAGGRAWMLAPHGAAPFDARMVDSEHPLFLAYTSGTTGRPKGTVAVHGGFGVKVAEEVAFQFDCRPDDTLFWFTDMGWIMGPWEVVGTLANGATLALYEGAPDWPEPDRLWSFLERHGVTILGISPTLIRALMPHGDGPVRSHDLSKLRVLGSTGEPWNLDPWRWYFDVVGGGRCPVINISGGTEVGACFLSPHPIEPIKPVSLGGPCLGMAVDVFDAEGQPIPPGNGEVGELVCTKPWPGMTRGIYNDPERYLETYWSTYPGVWRHGDWASVDADGQWYLHGRSDDTIKVAGKRLGPAEVESALVGHPAVVEAAAIGVPDEVKGEALWAFVVVAPDVTPDDELRDELTALVASQLGSSFRPSTVRFTSALPKTRNAKVLRRAIRATVLGQDAGDLSSLEDASTLDAVRSAT
ncbi:MAG TPA: AMP-binding protein [Acidimicrobiales bacterium]|nr:AMP-binding protein [Acidimicrobiales bacterium]